MLILSHQLNIAALFSSHHISSPFFEKKHAGISNMQAEASPSPAITSDWLDCCTNGDGLDQDHRLQGHTPEVEASSPTPTFTESPPPQHCWWQRSSLSVAAEHRWFFHPSVLTLNSASDSVLLIFKTVNLSKSERQTTRMSILVHIPKPGGISREQQMRLQSPSGSRQTDPRASGAASNPASRADVSLHSSSSCCSPADVNIRNGTSEPRV